MIHTGATVTCPPFDPSTGCGGVVAFLCSKKFRLFGNVDLKTKGLANATPFTKGAIADEPRKQNLRGLVGHENFNTRDHLTINYPDGTAFIMAEEWELGSAGKIGNPDVEGVARTRGQSITINGEVYNGEANVWGGSTILLAAKTITNFRAAAICKYSSLADDWGYGIQRCYIASETTLPCDEGLYAFDRIADADRLRRAFNITSYGDGSNGNGKNVKTQLNSYFAIVAMHSKRKKFEIKLVSGIENPTSAPLAEGALVMIHSSQRDFLHGSTVRASREFAGRFWLSTITSVEMTGGVPTHFTIRDAMPTCEGWNPTGYFMQAIIIPQFNNFTLSNSTTGGLMTNSATPPFTLVTHDGNNYGCGGILAIAVKNKCKLTSGGRLLVPDAGSIPPYEDATDESAPSGLEYISNAGMADRLPLGEGFGSVFILAQEIEMDTTTRLGAPHTGNAFGGINLDTNNANPRNDVYQWWRAGGTVFTDDGLKHARDGENDGVCGGGDGNTFFNGGFGNNGSNGVKAKQGAHILLVADKITGLCLDALSTGGQGGTASNTPHASLNGGCGYGGAGANYDSARGGNGGWLGGGDGGSRKLGGQYYYGGGGGSAGFCFVYRNS